MAMWTATVTENTGDGKEENLGTYIMHHVQNSNEWNIFGYHLQLPQFEPLNVLGMSIDLSITNHTVMLFLSALILIVMFNLAFRKKEVVPKGFAAILEMLVLFIRDDVAIANLGAKDGRKFTPLIASFFFYILICNMLGLIPLFTTPTGNVNVTAGLAIVTFMVGQIYGIKHNGFFGYFKGLIPGGVPGWLLPLMFVLEIMGLVAKHVALIIRLFANMVDGHIVLFAFVGLIIIFKSYFISPVSMGFAVFVYLLEILVAFIQAYVFTILSTLFIGMAIHQDH